MPRQTLALVTGGVLCATLFAFAFVAAPKSCEWGLAAYWWSGVACVLVLFALPFALRAAPSMRGRIGLALAFAVAGCGAWVAGCSRQMCAYCAVCSDTVRLRHPAFAEG